MTQRALKIIKDSSKQRTALYATAADFCRIFNDDMKNLYLLSLVLTADPEKAEQCLVSGLEDCAASNQVFKEWARSWARRVVIKNAIRMIAPGPERASQVLNPCAAKTRRASKLSWPETMPIAMSALLELPPFERFAFVMSVLEGCSDQDSGLLLGCTRESLVAARVRALQWIGSSGQLQADANVGAELREHQSSIEELALPARLATPA